LVRQPAARAQVVGGLVALPRQRVVGSRAPHEVMPRLAVQARAPLAVAGDEAAEVLS
jgi:predicted aconitase with swiveling domain